MQTPILETAALRVVIADAGAELISVFDKETGRERIWTADRSVWNRHAPILFPFVGKVTDGKYRVGSREYAMPTQHGFARDMVFDCSEESESAVNHVLQDTAETLRQYPFPFRLSIRHSLDADRPRRLHIRWTVENTGAEEMLYSIGGHPGFLIPDGMRKEDCFLVFPGREALSCFSADSRGFALPGTLKTLKPQDGFVPYREDIPETWIFGDSQVSAVGIAAPDRRLLVMMDCAQFPMLAVWANPAGPFICLEPWFGRTDDAGFCGTLGEKAGIQRLAPGGRQDISYAIDFFA